MYRVLLLLFIPLHLTAQVCITDSTTTVSVTETRPFLMSTVEFNDRLITKARAKLVSQVVGVQVYDAQYIEENGYNTQLDKTAQTETYATSSGTITNECLKLIRRNSRTSTVILTGTVLPTPNTAPLRRSNYSTPGGINPITRKEWLLSIPLLALYAIILL